MATGRIGVTPTLRTRWSKQPTAGTTSLSGLDDNSVSLVYDVGYEAVYRNGTLLSRGNDYTATNGTTVTLIDATLAGDIIEILANQLVPLTDAISKGQFTAKGALLSATAASTPGVLAVGANDTVLTADSTTSTGLKWATPAAGGMTLLSTTNLSGITTTVSSISGAYTNLLVIVQDAKVASASGVLRIFPNGTGAGNVSYNINISSAVSSGTVIQGRTAVPTTALKGSFTALINLYSDATYNKNFIAYGGMDPASTGDQNFLTGTVAITSAITSVDISTSNQADSFNGGRVLIYGVK